MDQLELNKEDEKIIIDMKNIYWCKMTYINKGEIIELGYTSLEDIATKFFLSFLKIKNRKHYELKDVYFYPVLYLVHPHSGIVMEENEDSQQLMYIDTNGNIIIEPIYYEIMICKNGIFVVRYSESDSKTPYGSNNWKFITKEGELLYKTSKNEYLINKVHNLEECNDECYVFGQLQNEYNKFKYGLIAANGKKILLPIYDWIEYAGEGFWILKENNSFYLFSKTTGLQNPKEFLKFQ